GDYDTIEVRQVTWDGALEWSFSDWTQLSNGQSVARQHHDFQREGSAHGTYAPQETFVTRGNTLVLAHLHVEAPAIRPGTLQDDVIYEVDWTGALTNFVWRGQDHLDEFGFDDAA